MAHEASTDPADPRLLSGQAWRELCAALERASQRVLGEGVPDAPRDRAEGFRHLARFLASGLASCVTHDDPDYPVFGRMIDYARPWGLDNPDCLYLYAPLRGKASYRVWGRRGGACWLEFQVNWGHFANGDIAQWGTIGALDGDALLAAPDGSFELWIGGPERARNWIPSADNAEFLLVRQLFGDWEAERPADLWIEREGAAWPIPSPRTDWMADRLEKLSRWLERGGALWEKMSRAYLSLPENSLVFHMPEGAGARAGAGGQAYGMGNFRCAPDEAVILEFDPPPCRYWGISLANWWWECVEYASRQASLNQVQARADSDGRVRCVIAHADPGIANWLDPAGNVRGSLTARFVKAARKPEVTLRRVPLEALDAALPRDTPRASPAERAAALERRRRAVIGRHRR
jgi:hypothetical protein